MNNIVIIGSGPSGLLTAFYLYKKYDNIKCIIISNNFNVFKNTFCVFLDHIENTWIYEYFDKTKLFLNILNISLEFDNNEKIDCDKKYGIINNEYIHNTIMNFLNTTNIEFIKGTVSHINKRLNKYNILFKENNSFKNILTDFIFEATGSYDICKDNKKKNYDEYYQYFYGYKLKLEKAHNFDKCTLLNWNTLDDNYSIKSFCYVLPFNKNEVLIEETILSTNKKKYYFDLLETRLKKRINNYNLEDYKIVDKEVFRIPLNKEIQDPTKTNFSFKIGVCGNMINNLSGYSLGYNIYHIPEFCKYMQQGSFSHNYVISNFWNNKRHIINNINNLGLELMENFTQEEMSEFHYYYFKYILNTSNFDIMFLNKDHNISYFQTLWSFTNYLYFPKKFLGSISYLIFDGLKKKLNYNNEY